MYTKLHTNDVTSAVFLSVFGVFIIEIQIPSTFVSNVSSFFLKWSLDLSYIIDMDHDLLLAIVFKWRSRAYTRTRCKLKKDKLDFGSLRTSNRE